MRNNINNKKGNISIIGIIIAIIIVTAISGFLSIMNSSWIYNEVQSIMDLCAINTLQSSIDSQALKKEVLGVNNDLNDGSSTDDTSINSDAIDYSNINKTKVNNILKIIYQEELNKNIKTNNMISNIKLVSFNGDLVYSDWGANYEGVTKKRPQLRLDAITQITLKTNSQFDTLDNYDLHFFDSKNNGNITINVAGVTADGNIILTVRTLTRVLYK